PSAQILRVIGGKTTSGAEDPILILALDNGGGVVRAHRARRGRLQIRAGSVRGQDGQAQEKGQRRQDHRGEWKEPVRGAGQGRDRSASRRGGRGRKPGTRWLHFRCGFVGLVAWKHA